MFNEILFWLLPTGWLCSLAQFFIHRRKTSTDDFVSMINDIKREMLNVQRENIKLYAAVRELSSILALAGGCSFYDVCPINNKLQNSQQCSAGISIFKDEQPTNSGDHDAFTQMGHSEENA